MTDASPAKTDAYAGTPIAETLSAMETDAAHGLAGKEVENRLARFGYTELEEKEESLWHRRGQNRPRGSRHHPLRPWPGLVNDAVKILAFRFLWR